MVYYISMLLLFQEILAKEKELQVTLLFASETS